MKLKGAIILIFFMLAGCTKSQGQFDVHPIATKTWSVWVTLGDKVLVHECLGQECK